MASRYQKGQKIVIMPGKNQDLSQRNPDLEPYIGQSGEVIDYYWIRLDRGAQVVYVYTIEIDNSQKEIVLHEDELEPL